jgi:hypothetical protein
MDEVAPDEADRLGKPLSMLRDFLGDRIGFQSRP